ncbi:cytochrome P450 4c21-like [Harmonia axyridis]|uniref:cytochrome P450 4c21-like n=1 Tax=Harmonia axyridis TaxID=115357 RepID=UPI001E2796EB|nr:cytochrome P450 4c21-like [Harmonia axyridis]
MILPILILVIFLLVILKYVFKDIDESEKIFQKIPGPKGFPFFGNIQDLFCNDEVRWNRLRARALKYYPIFKMEVLNQKMVHLFDPSDIQVILSNPKYISKGIFYEPMRYWLGDGLLVSAGEKWKKNRRLLTKSFHFGVLKNYMHIFNELSENLKSCLNSNNGEPTELISVMEYHSLNIICTTLAGDQFGIEKTSKKFLSSLETLTRMVYIKMTVPLMNFLYKFTYLLKEETEAMKSYKDFARALIEKNRDSNDVDDDTDLPRLLKILSRNFDSQGVEEQMNTFLFAVSEKFKIHSF